MENRIADTEEKSTQLGVTVKLELSHFSAVILNWQGEEVVKGRSRTQKCKAAGELSRIDRAPTVLLAIG
jgi:hypothetical protein